jgi:trigger factor
MQVSIETLDGLERRMTVQIPSETVTQAVEKKLNELRRTVKIDGFRPGKVPLKVVQQKYGGHVRQEVIGNVIETSYHEAITQEKVRPAGVPNIESVDSEGQEEMSFTATFEIYPEIEKIDFETVELEKPVVEITDESLEAMVLKLREQRKEWVEVSRSADTGDQVLVDFEGKIDGELFEGGAGTDMAVEIGAGTMLEEFEAGLKGIIAGEEKLVEVNFPENYQGKEVAGKKAEFSLKATRVSEALIPELDETLAKSFGVEDGNLETFRADIRANMTKELSQKLKTHVKQAALSALLEANNVIAPTALVNEEAKSLKMQAAQRMGQDPGSFDASSLPDEMFVEEARNRVRTGLLIGEVVKSEQVELDPALVESTLSEMAATYEEPEQVMDYYRQNQEARTNLEAMVLEQQVVNLILDKAKVTDKETSFEDMMNNSI